MFFRRTSFLWVTIFLLTLLVYGVGLFVTVMDPDAGTYAAISMTMYDTGNYLEIFSKGFDWLDKPHFHFWITAFSYNLFGVNTVAYKLPAVLFVLAGAYYTYLFGRRYYSKQHGFLAAMILITAQHIITSNIDVRAEPYMTGLTIMALFHFAVYLGNKKLLHLVAGSVGLGCLIMTKGLFTIIPVAAGIGGALLYRLRWKEIFHWQWLVVLVLVAIFISPAVYGYYTQFDLHPEKEIFGQQGISGVEFFLWTSQWGRFANTGPIKGSGDPLNFVYTLLWAFAPWAFLAFYGLYQKTKQLFKKIKTGEHYTYFGFVTMFLIFSASKFQLSHYLNPVFPLLAIITAFAILSILKNIKALKIFTTIQLLQCILFIAAIGLLHYYFSGEVPHADTIIILAAGILLTGYLFLLKAQWGRKIIFGSTLVILIVNYYLNREFYPSLLKYQSETEMAFYYKKQNLPVDQLISYDEKPNYSDVILRKNTPAYKITEAGAAILNGKYVYTTENGLHALDSLGLRYEMIKTFDEFHTTRLNKKFINRFTREQELKKEFLVKVDKEKF